MSIEPSKNGSIQQLNINPSPASTHSVSQEGSDTTTNPSPLSTHPVTQEEFNTTYHYVDIPETNLCRTLKNHVARFNTKSCLFCLLPVLRWLPTYKWKQNFISDFISGYTVAVLQIPQGLAYSTLAGVPPAVGIYTAVFPVFIYFLYASSRHVNMGTFAIVSVMVSKPVHLLSTPPDSNSSQTATLQSSYTPTQVSTILCLVVGIWQVIFGVVRLGSLSVLMSETLISGFTTGAAVLVLTSQMKHVFEIRLPYHDGPFKLIYTYVDLVRMIKQTNYTALILTVCVVVILIVNVQYIKPRLAKKTRFPLPIELVMVIIGTLISKHFQLSEMFNITVVGSIPTGLPEPSVPPLPLIPNVLVDSLIIALVAFSINISMATMFARKDNYKIDGNQELLACGFGNMVGSLFSCLPISASLTRSLIQYNVGGKTQLASVVSCFLLIMVLLFIGPFFEPLPLCVLAGIIVVALRNMLLQVKDLPMMWRHNRQDGIIWLITFFSVILIDIEIGLGVGVVASLVSIILMSQTPQINSLGNLPNTDLYLDIDRYDMAEPVPNTIIIQICGGLHFANNNFVRVKIKKLLKKELRDETKPDINKFIIDMSAVTFVDHASSQLLLDLASDLEQLHISLCLAKCSVYIIDQLKKSEFFQTFPEMQLFPSVHNAVLYVPNSEDDDAT